MEKKFPSALTPEVCEAISKLLADSGFQFADYLDLLAWISSGLRLEVLRRSMDDVKKSTDPQNDESVENS